MENKGKTPYFPTPGGEVKCRECDRQGCMARDRFQRNRQDFTVTSGRCPRLPNYRGFVDSEDRELYEATFPLVHAEREDTGKLTLTLTAPGMKRPKRVYPVKGYWYIREPMAGNEEYHHQPRRVITLEGHIETPQQIMNIMDAERTNRLVFRCTVEDYFI